MSETAVAEPLSGAEIIEAIVFRLKEQLSRDCFLSPTAAYEYFSGSIQVTITAVDCGRQATIKTTATVTKGDEKALQSGEGYKVDSTEELAKAAPNVVRRETDQQVPISVADGGGKVETKRVKYQRQERKSTPSTVTKTKVPAPPVPPAA